MKKIYDLKSGKFLYKTTDTYHGLYYTLKDTLGLNNQAVVLSGGKCKRHYFWFNSGRAGNLLSFVNCNSRDCKPRQIHQS